MMERLFLIGGSGFIGKNLVRNLYGKYDITVFDKYLDKEYFANYSDVRLFPIELDKDRISEKEPSE